MGTQSRRLGLVVALLAVSIEVASLSAASAGAIGHRTEAISPAHVAGYVGTHWPHQGVTTLPTGLAAVLQQRLQGDAEGHSWPQQAELHASDAAQVDLLGFSVALSEDGRTALVGAFGKNNLTGAVYVFTRDEANGAQQEATWTQQAELHASDGVAGDEFGDAVALSGDGRTALIGARDRNTQAGAVYVFTRDEANGAQQEATWTQQAELHASDAAFFDTFGSSIALSMDGRTALIGADGKNGSTGTAYVFIRDETTRTQQEATWTQQAELRASDGAANDFFGYAVAVSGDGSTALVGGHGKSNFTGAAYVFIRDETWRQQAELHAGNPAQSDSFGSSLTLSGDGRTALIGAYGTNTFKGVAYVFGRDDAIWTQRDVLRASDGARYDFFGFAVSLSADAHTALIGAYDQNSGTGAAYVFTRDDTWMQQAELHASDGSILDNFGTSVVLSADAHTALIGASGKNQDTGAAYVFNRG